MKKQSFNHSRRSFLRQSTKATLAMGVGSTLVGSVMLNSCSNPAERSEEAGLTTGFSQTGLGYDYSALEPNIDAMTMEIHYTKHAAGYADNLIKACGEEGVDMDELSLEEVLNNISNYSTNMRNNGGGHYNHELFWKIMSPEGGGEPTGSLADAIKQSFGSFQDFATQFEDAAKGRFGSGWAWLVVDGNQNLAVGSTPNQDNPLMDLSDFKGVPLMGIDVWEHAYYLEYQNERPRYITNWWNVVDWAKVGERYEALV